MADVLHPFRWLRRIAVAMACVAVLLVVLWLVVGQVAERRWARTVERLRAQNVPLDIADLNRPPVPDRDNAAHYLQLAAAAVDPTNHSPRSSNYQEDELGARPPYTTLWRDLASASTSGSAKAFGLARQARSCKHVDWNVVFASPAWSVVLPHLNKARHLANTVCDAAELAFIEGDHPEGVERIRDSIALARLINDRPFLVTALVSRGITALTCKALAPHVGTLRIGSAPGEAAADQVRALIAELLAAGENNVMPGAMRNDIIGALDSGSLAAKWATLTRPVVTLDRVRIAERSLTLVAAAENPSVAERWAILEANPAPQMYLTPGMFGGAPAAPFRPRFSAPLLHTVAFLSFERGISTDERVRVGCHVAAIMLAVRLYELEHAGQWPPSLEALVPNYLPAIPKNPIARNDGPYVYELLARGLPDGRDRPVLRTDGGERPQAAPAEPLYATDSGRVFDLTSWTPTAPQPR